MSAGNNFMNKFEMKYPLTITILVLCILFCGCNTSHKQNIKNKKRISNTTTNNDKVMSESDKLLKALSSKDRKAAQASKLKLYGHEFDENDVDSIFSALKKDYWDDYGPGMSVKCLLMMKLAKIGDVRIQDFIAEIYPKLEKNGLTLTYALSALISLNTSESTETALHLTTRYHRDVEKDYSLVFQYLAQNTRLKKHVFEALCKDPNTLEERLSLYELAANWLWNGDIDQHQFRKCADNLNIVQDIYTIFPHFTDISKAIETKESDIDNQTYYSLGVLLDLLGWLPANQENLNILKTAIVIFGGETQMYAAVSMVHLGHEPNATLAMLLAESPETRTRFFECLMKIHRMNYFPKKYRTQFHMAEGDMVQWLCHPLEYGRPPVKIELIEKRVIRRGKGIYGNVYLFKYSYPNEKDGEMMVGLAGLFPVDERKVEKIGRRSMTFSHFKRLRDMTIEEHFDSLLDVTPFLSMDY